VTATPFFIYFWRQIQIIKLAILELAVVKIVNLPVLMKDLLPAEG
jgi:hypothetical protein